MCVCVSMSVCVSVCMYAYVNVSVAGHVLERKKKSVGQLSLIRFMFMDLVSQINLSASDLHGSDALFSTPRTHPYHASCMPRTSA